MIRQKTFKSLPKTTNLDYFPAYNLPTRCFGTFPVGQPSKALPDTPTLGHFLSISLPKHCLIILLHNVFCRSTFQSTAWYAYFGSLPVNQPSEALPPSDNFLSTKSPKHSLIRLLWIISSRLTFQSTDWYAYFGSFPVDQISKALPETHTLDHLRSTSLPKHCLIRLLWNISCQPTFQSTAWYAYFGTFQVNQPSKALPDTPTLDYFLSTNLSKLSVTPIFGKLSANNGYQIY